PYAALSTLLFHLKSLPLDVPARGTSEIAEGVTSQLANQMQIPSFDDRVALRGHNSLDDVAKPIHVRIATREFLNFIVDFSAAESNNDPAGGLKIDVFTSISIAMPLAMGPQAIAFDSDLHGTRFASRIRGEIDLVVAIARRR